MSDPYSMWQMFVRWGRARISQRRNTPPGYCLTVNDNEQITGFESGAVDVAADPTDSLLEPE